MDLTQRLALDRITIEITRTGSPPTVNALAAIQHMSVQEAEAVVRQLQKDGYLQPDSLMPTARYTTLPEPLRVVEAAEVKPTLVLVK